MTFDRVGGTFRMGSSRPRRGARETEQGLQAKAAGKQIVWRLAMLAGAGWGCVCVVRCSKHVADLCSCGSSLSLRRRGERPLAMSLMGVVCVR